MLMMVNDTEDVDDG